MNPDAALRRNAENRPAQPVDLRGIKTGDIIDFAGKKMKVQGMGPEGSGFAFMARDLTPEEQDAYAQREAIVGGKIKNQIESNPQATVDVEGARRYWRRMYDEAGNGQRMEMQLNEIYAQKYEVAARLARERMQVLELELNLVTARGEREAVLAKIVEEREFAIEMDAEANARRGYTTGK